MRKRLHQFRPYTTKEAESSQPPNILWLAMVESPSNCVVFSLVTLTRLLY